MGNANSGLINDPTSTKMFFWRRFIRQFANLGKLESASMQFPEMIAFLRKEKDPLDLVRALQDWAQIKLSLIHI